MLWSHSNFNVARVNYNHRRFLNNQHIVVMVGLRYFRRNRGAKGTEAGNSTSI
jgi:hypothetical protein